MNGFKNKFTKIKGISDRRRLPRLGKIRLGVKVKSQKTGNEYPKETDYFVCPDEVIEAYKKEYPDGHIKELDVMFPLNDPEIIFPQAYKWYGSTKGLKCMGNGETAMRLDEKSGGFEEIECPCKLLDEGKCQRRAHLMVMLPKVSMGGIYQIDIGSANSIIDINSGIDYVRALAEGALGFDRFALIPLKLKRVPRETHHDNKKQIHYTLQLHCSLNAMEWNRIRGDFRIISPAETFALPPIEDTNPVFDEGATVIEEEDIEKVEPEKPKKEKKTKEKSPQKKEQKEKKLKARGIYLAEIWKTLETHFPDQKEEKLIEMFGEKDWEKIKKDLPADVLARGLGVLIEQSEGEDNDLPFKEDGSPKEE